MSNQISAHLELELATVYNQGFNIYGLIAKVKKLIGQPKDWQFPEEVLLRICKAYKQDKAKIGKPWPWFIKVLKTESALWHASQQIKLNDKRSKWAFSIKDILK